MEGGKYGGLRERDKAMILEMVRIHDRKPRSNMERKVRIFNFFYGTSSLSKIEIQSEQS